MRPSRPLRVGVPDRRRPAAVAACGLALGAAALLLRGLSAAFLLAPSARAPAGSAPHAARGRPVSGRAEARTATAATATASRPARKRAKGAKGKYRGAVNPRLRSLLQSSEYRRLISLLSSVNDQGQLDTFLERAESYWAGINIFQLALEEQKGGGRGVLNTVRKDWPRVWPEALDGERMQAFDLFSDFWKRLDRSKLVDNVMQDVLPDSEKGYSDLMESRDQKKLASMTDDERRDEILKRLGSSDIVKQFAILSKNDGEVQAIGSKMTPFVAKFVAILERKVATQTEALGKSVDYGLIAVAVLVVVVALAFFGVIKLPNL